MLTTIRMTRMQLDHIEQIEAEEVKEFPELATSQRTLTLWTTEGEKYELVLEAKTPEQLEFKTPADWLGPKLYHGRSMHGQEEDV